MYFFYYIDSLKQRHKIYYELNAYGNVMELIWDQGYEDWGDCRGRAWCATCHIKVNTIDFQNTIDQNEKKRLNQLSNKRVNSRLSCQLLLNATIHQTELEFIGDD